MRRWVLQHRKFCASASYAVATALVGYIVSLKFDLWHVGVAVLSAAILFTLVPLLFSVFNFSDLNPPGDWFDTADYLGADQARVLSHYTRIYGALRYWKNKAAMYNRLHSARVIWSLISAVSLPVLVQRYDRGNVWASFFMTELTTWTGLLVSLAYTLKAEERYQGLRQQESDFYDASRKFLDEAAAARMRGVGDDEIHRLCDSYILEIRAVRRVARRIETGSPPSALP